MSVANSSFFMRICTEGLRNLFELGFEGDTSYGIFKISYFVCFLVCLATLSEIYILRSVEMENHYEQYLGMMWKRAVVFCFKVTIPESSWRY
jgi:hypothetical protein